jgi:hypothetical protein
LVVLGLGGAPATALAWAIAAPPLLGLLLWLVSPEIDLGESRLLRAAVGILGCAGLATAAGLAARAAAAGGPLLARVVLASAAILVVFLLALGRLEGLSAAGMIRARRGR